MSEEQPMRIAALVALMLSTWFASPVLATGTVSARGTLDQVLLSSRRTTGAPFSAVELRVRTGAVSPTYVSLPHPSDPLFSALDQLSQSERAAWVQLFAATRRSSGACSVAMSRLSGTATRPWIGRDTEIYLSLAETPRSSTPWTPPAGSTGLHVASVMGVGVYKPLNDLRLHYVYVRATNGQYHTLLLPIDWGTDEVFRMAFLILCAQQPEAFTLTGLVAHSLYNTWIVHSQTRVTFRSLHSRVAPVLDAWGLSFAGYLNRVDLSMSGQACRIVIGGPQRYRQITRVLEYDLSMTLYSSGALFPGFSGGVSSVMSHDRVVNWLAWSGLWLREGWIAWIDLAYDPSVGYFLTNRTGVISQAADLPLSTQAVDTGLTSVQASRLTALHMHGAYGFTATVRDRSGAARTLELVPRSSTLPIGVAPLSPSGQADWVAILTGGWGTYNVLTVNGLLPSSDRPSSYALHGGSFAY